MSNLPQSDWILAGRFVDHDLSSAEAAQTESRIATDPQFAAAVEELRHQSNLFSDLPNFKPTDDLKERTVQASLDQVKAFMGAWPIEQRNELSGDSGSASASAAATNSFDWKSAAALVASLAGVLIIGTMLWPSHSTTHDANVAMESAPVEADAVESTVRHDEASKNDDADSTLLGHSKGGPSLKQKAVDQFADTKPGPTPPLSKAFPKSANVPAVDRAIANEDIIRERAGPRTVNPRKMAKVRGNQQLPEMGPMFGTPMKKSKVLSPGQQELAANSNAPIEQIWCVHQDRDVSREAVSQILNLNEIKVQREQPPSSVYANKEPVEAFYVAATQQQMMLAMSQISNNADVEMIQLPSSINSPIADAIAQQFAGAGAGVGDGIATAEAAPQEQAVVPPRFREPESQALAQQLFANSIPRNFVPSGPVPPILNSSDLSNLDLNDLDFKSESDAEPMSDRMSKPGGRADIDIANQSPSEKSLALEADEEPALGAAAEGLAGGAAAQQAQRQSQSVANELKKLEEDAGNQLRQYLILVRGGEEEK